MDPTTTDALSHLLSLTFATSSSCKETEADAVSSSSVCSVKALLAVPPAEMARYMVFDAPVQNLNDGDDSAVALIGGEKIGMFFPQENGLQ